MPTATFGRSLNPLEKDDESKQQPKDHPTFTRLLPRMSPSLYAIPNEIPLPNCQSSFSPSPYMVINHKARVISPSKTASEVVVVDASSQPKTLKEEKICGGENAIADDNTNGVIFERPVWDCSPPHCEIWNEKPGKDIGNNTAVEWESYLLEPVRLKADKESLSQDFSSPVESVSFRTRTEMEDDAGAENSDKLATAFGEFYDACDELSSECGTQSSLNDIDTELREMRLSLLMEIERRRQAEETLEKMHVHWRRLREQLADAGVFLPLDPTSSQYSINVADELRCQLEVVRFVSDSLGSSLANAEVVMEMESELEAKNFEITRLSERLHYYETVNQELCQRNQEEAIEATRREGQKRKRRQIWIWGSIAATITLGSAVLAWSYLPAGTLSSVSDVAKPQPLPESEVKLQNL